MNEKVSVTVNGEQTTFFLGLSVRHAIGAGATRDVERGWAEVRDAAGNQVGLDGALYDGESLTVHTRRSAPVPAPDTGSGGMGESGGSGTGDGAATPTGCTRALVTFLGYTLLLTMLGARLLGGLS